MPKHHLSTSLVLVFIGLSTGALQAQIKPANPQVADVLSKADPVATKAWVKLSLSFSGGQKPDQPTAGPSADSLASDALARADAAKAFYQLYPKYPKAVEARKLEILALLDADNGNSPAITTRLAATQLALRRDPTVPATDRAAVAGFYDFRQASKRIGSIQQPDTAAYEQAARGLITEFPEQPQGYVSLLTLAAQRNNPRGPTIAQELATTSPDSGIRRSAQRLATRLGLKGQKLSAVLPAVADLEAKNDGRLTIVYAWSVADPGSLATAALLGQRHVERAVWIGVNMDQKKSREAAEKAAIAGKFPGRQIYDELGSDGDAATALGFDSLEAGLFVGSDGTIAEVYTPGELLETINHFGL